MKLLSTALEEEIKNTSGVAEVQYSPKEDELNKLVDGFRGRFAFI